MKTFETLETFETVKTVKTFNNFETVEIFENAGVNLNARGEEMDHFIGMWPHLQFDHGELAKLNALHVAALHGAYRDLYGALDL